jgi:1-acyl-sn-glycerol-3-phosphate acyltransferase
MALFRAARSCFFFFVYFLYLVFFFELVERLFLVPYIAVFPKQRVPVVSVWFRVLAHSTLALTRILAGVRLRVEGRLPPGALVLVMNHQSLLDIPIAYSVANRPYAVIPTRKSYARGIPGVSLLLRMGRHPLVEQTDESRRRDLLSIVRAAEAVSRGETSLLIFPEGHRTRDGSIGPFMGAGLRTVLKRADKPVHLLVVDGYWRSRNTAESLLNFAGMDGVLRIVGPLRPESGEDEGAFADRLRARMCAELDDLRGASAGVAAEA